MTNVLQSAAVAFTGACTHSLPVMENHSKFVSSVRRRAVLFIREKGVGLVFAALVFFIWGRSRRRKQAELTLSASRLSSLTLSPSRVPQQPPEKAIASAAGMLRRFGLDDDFFELGARLGVGGQGVVHQCIQLNTGDQYAAKVMNFSPLADAKKKRMLLKREICIMRELHHPHIVNVLVAFWEEDFCTIVMDLAKGGDLFHKVEADLKCAISRGDCFSGLGGNELVSKHVAKQLLQGINYMHLNKVVHRDLKLDNILITQSYSCSSVPGSPEVHDIKIADFGLSRVLSSIGGQCFADLDQLTAVGTPAYVAPEVLEEVYDETVDYWSFGVILYAMHCGQMPFVINSLLPDRHKEAVSNISQCDSWNLVSPEGQAMVRGLLQINPEKRFNFERCLRHPWCASCFEDVPGFARMTTPFRQISSISDYPISHVSQLSPGHAFSGEESELVGAVHRITGSVSNYVHVVEMALADSSVVAYGPEHYAPDVLALQKSTTAGSLATNITYELDPAEFIIGVMQSRSVETCNASGILGDALVFYTSQSRVVALQGTDSRRRHRFVTPEGYQIVGLQFEGSVLTGTHIELVPPSGKGAVEQVSGRQDANVESVHIRLRSGRTQFFGGSGGHDHGPYVLNDTELILIVEQGFRERSLGASLVFYTSHGRLLKFAGKTGASSRRFAATSKQQICGLHFEGSSLSKVQTCCRTANLGGACWHKVS